MDYATVQQRLSLTCVHDDAWRDDFHRSGALASADNGSLWIESRVRALATMIRLADDVQDAFVGVLPQFQHVPALRRLLWHCHYLLFVESTGPIDSQQRLPMLPAHLGLASEMFYAMVFLSGIDKVLARHRAHHVPDDVSADTLHDIEIWMRDHRAKRGGWGLSERWWPSTYFSGALLKLGRLQFLMTRFNWPFIIFRSCNSDQVIALAETGARFRADGQFYDADESIDPDAWTAELRETGSIIRGHAISTRGVAEQHPIELAADQWKSITRRGDGVLDIHIPAIGPLNDDAVAASLAQAMTSFPEHYPEFSYRAFTCMSWLLDPQLRDHLPVSSNVVRFLNRFHLLPVPGANHRQTYERVLGDPDISIDHAPAKTRLHRAIIAHVRAGGRWRMTGGIIPRV